MKKTIFLVKGGRTLFLLNALLRAGITLERIEQGEGEIRLWVDFADASRLEHILTEHDFTYETQGYRGVKPFLSRLIRRPFLIVATVLTLVAIFFFESFVYGYSVEGNQYVNTESVVAILRENQVDGFTYKGSIDLKEIRREIVALDGVSFASVKIIGNRLRVEVKEELPRETPDLLSYDPICSLYHAVVTKVVAESGTPRVASGDTVEVGDLLIEPYYAFTEGGTEAPARGEVWGRVTYQKEVILPAFTAETVLTGEIFRTRTVLLFGREIGKREDPPFDAYDLIERTIFRGIGVTVIERTYRRRAAETVYHDFDGEASALIEEARRELLMSVPFYARERGGARVTQKKVDNVLHIVIYYTTEQRIDPLPIAR